MPVSTTVHLSQCMRYILDLDPKSVLDVGCGFGLWGFLCRMQLDVAKERVAPETWQIRIDGIEYFAPYIQDHHRALYTAIHLGDIRNLAKTIGPYDLIIAGDVIEHLERDDAEAVLDLLYEKADKALLVGIPLGLGWDHPARHGNPQELHRSIWQIEDFAPYAGVGQVFALPCGDYGVFCCRKDTPPDSRREALFITAQKREAEGRVALAEMYARRLHALDTANETAAYFLADLLLHQAKNEQAVEVLHALLQANPNCSDAARMIEEVKAAMPTK